MQPARPDCDVAVVGLGGVFPGAASPAQFWSNIVAGRSFLRPVPEGRWIVDPAKVIDPAGGPDRVPHSIGGYVEDFHHDIAGLGIAADGSSFADYDPLVLMGLHAAGQALQDASIDAAHRRRAGAIMAAIALPSDGANALTRATVGGALASRVLGATPPTAQELTRSSLGSAVCGLPAAIIADAFGLAGGGYTLDAACASSLYAVKLACDELTSGRRDLMVAGGLSRPDPLYTQMGFTQLQALSPTGVCAPFDAGSNGLIVGEGAGALVLKRLDDAVSAGDRIYAVIRGIGVSNDIGGSLLAPDSEGQLRAMRAAYDTAGWRPDEVDLIECHGTGTPRGDAAEVRSLLELWADAPRRSRSCAIGSVKSMIGHLLTAAGAAGLIKTIMALHQRLLPPSANYRDCGDVIPLRGSPFHVQTSAEPWQQPAEKASRKAAVSAFGFGGINGHVLLEEWAREQYVAKHSVRVNHSGHTTGQSDIKQHANVDNAEPIAIVGIDARFGSLIGADAFTAAVLSGDAKYTEATTRRDWRMVLPSDDNGLGDLMQAGFFINELPVAVGEFKIPPNEIAAILPQQLLMLQSAGAALDDAGMPRRASRPQLGAIIGMDFDIETTNFHLRWWLREVGPRWAEKLGLPTSERAAWIEQLIERTHAALNAPGVVGNLGGMIASRVAREFGCGGPSFGVSSGDTSALTALEIAARSLQQFEIDACIVGGVDFNGDARLHTSCVCPQPAIDLSLPPLDQNSHGSPIGDGAGALVVKRLSDAQRDGDRVYAVVRGFGKTVHSGMYPASHSDSVGNTLALPEAMREAIEEAGIRDADVGLLQLAEQDDHAHSFGPAIRSIADGVKGPDGAITALANVVNCVGDCGAAKGMAALLSSIVALSSKRLPVARGFQEPPSAGRPDLNERAIVAVEPQYWYHDRASGARTAVVALTTYENNAATVVLTEADPVTTETRRIDIVSDSVDALPAVICFAADDLGGVVAEFSAAHQELASNNTPWHTLVAKWANRFVECHSAKYRASLVADDRQDAAQKIQQLQQHLNQQPMVALDGRTGIYFTPPAAIESGKTALVFPGSGNQYLGMGRAIHAALAPLMAKIESKYDHLATELMARWVTPLRCDWREGWRDEAKQSLAEDMRRVIFAQVTFGMVMHDLLGELGIRPDAVIGYSLGESTSLFATRAWPDDAEMLRRMMASSLFKDDLYDERRVLQRAWQLSATQAAEWQTVILPRPVDDVRAALDGLPYARLMIVNTPSECVVGGMPDEIATAAQRLGCRAIPVEDVPTVHIDAVHTVENAYRSLHVMHTEVPHGVDLYSCHLGRRYDVNQQTAAESITAQALHGFDFTRVIESAYADGVRQFIEVGPQASCTRMIRKTMGERQALVVSASGRPDEELQAFANFLAACCTHGLPVRLDKIFAVPTTQGSDSQSPTKQIVNVPVGMATPDLDDLPFVSKGSPTEMSSSDANTIDISDAATEPVQILESAVERNEARDLRSLDSHVDESKGLSTTIPAADRETVQTTPGFIDSSQETSHDEMNMTLTDDMHAILAASRATAAAHERYFAFAAAARDGLTAAAQLQAELVQQALASGQAIDLGALAAEVQEIDSVSSQPLSPTHKSVPQPQRGRGTHLPVAPYSSGDSADRQVPLPFNTEHDGGSGEFIESRNGGDHAAHIEPMFPRELCMEFAIGKLANVLGPMFADVDSYPVRVRLPDWPLMLVDRILTVEGEMGSLTGGRIVTEHDVYEGAWYLDGNCAPVCVTVEAGQADLFLSSYLGIDLAVKGTRAYRLLDATVTFHRHLPRPGETIRYDIHIDRFVRQGETYLFFFRFDGTINGETVLTMRDGCAGFFTDAEIENSGGIILTKEDTAWTAGKRDESFVDIVPMQVENYNDEHVAALRKGDLAGCFGPMFADLGLQHPLSLPDGRMKLFDRVLELDPNGGRFGLGRIRAEADIHPDDWFLTCHFIDDMTMPGTLMYECCVHALRFFLLRMGWVGEAEGVSYEPLHNLSSALKCRGPVTQITKKVIYEVDIKEIGYNPKPYVIADALMLGDGRKIVRMTDMSLEIQGLSREAIEAVWNRRADGNVPQPQKGRGNHDDKRRNVGTSERQNLTADHAAIADTHALNAEAARPVLYDKQSILEFSNGRPSLAFGEPYQVFDAERVIARLPGPPFQFLDRVVAVDAEPFVLKPTGWIETEYDVPADAWYFEANRQPTMPFAVILEAALQPCGWLAAYCGSALRSKTDLSFRNLGGTATLHREIYPDVGTLTVRVRMTNVNEAGGMIIQDYDMQLSDARGVVYEGVTHFGFFSKAALAQQVGVRDAGERRYTPSDDELATARRFEFDTVPPILPEDAEGILGEYPGAQRGLLQPAKAFLMLERVDALTTTGGPNGLGFVRGSTGVNLEAWFFEAHFYQDPVWPGSLGLESFLQLLKAYALERWGGAFVESHSFEAIATGVEQTWVYRGQVIPKNQRVDVEAVITRVDDGPQPLVMADGFLVVDGIPIYEMKDFAVRLVRR